MSEIPPPKVEPEALALRAQPRRVVRFRRNVLIAAGGVGAAVILGVTWLALRGPGVHHGKSGDDQSAAERKATPDALASLPATYGQAVKAPLLGPPLPGDLGPSILERQKQLAATQAPTATSQAAQAEADRVAQLNDQVRSAGLFFQVGQHGAAAALPPGTGAGPAEAAPSATSAPGTPHVALDLEKDQNDQQHKLDFMSQASHETIEGHTLQAPPSPYTVMAGAVIAASLLTGLNSDLPGLATAQVTEPVYDTATGKILLIPQGSRLIGSYDSVVAFGQSRALLVWQRIVMPDGSSIQIDNLPAADPAGYTGLKDKVDFHTWTLLKGIGMSTLLGIGSQATFGSGQSNLVEAIRESTLESTNQAGQRIVEKDLNIQPTITVRPGSPLRIIVHKDLVLKPYPN